MARENSSIRPTLNAIAGNDLFSDTVDFAFVARGVYIAAGTVLVYVPEGQTAAVTMTNPALGIVHPITARRINATTTDVTGVLLYYDPPELQA